MSGLVAMRTSCEALSRFVDHYWRSRDSDATHHVVLPDGCVDLVIEVGTSSAHAWLYGTTTRRTEIPVRQESDYVGIRFRPGQARHFFALPAHALTDTCVPAVDAAGICAPQVVERIATGMSADGIDAVLQAWLARNAPVAGPVDAALHCLRSPSPPVTVAELSARVGVGRRRLERLFLEHVGVPPKTYATILRCRRAARALARGDASCSEIAFAAGYADQSHMTREFGRMLGHSPRALQRTGVAFLQDLGQTHVQS